MSKKIKYSVVIPTYNHFRDALLPCIESIIKYTDFSETEIIVVANGCVDETKDYLATLPKNIFKTIWIDAPSGYTVSTNRGIDEAEGDYIILLNNDTALLPQPINQWLHMLEEPFTKDPLVGASGPMLNYCPHSERNFLIFFCVMIKVEMFEKFGLLDEIFNPGFGEDTDFCIKLQDAGYKCIQVPIEGPLIADSNQERMTGFYPVWHAGEITLGVMPEGNALLAKNRKILEDRYKNKKPNYEVKPQYHIFNATTATIKEEPKTTSDPFTHLTKLNIGCGDALLPGYLNTDLYNPNAQVKADATKLPFPNGRFEEVISIQVFEHLPCQEAMNILTEWKRVLKPGGKLVIEVPNIQELCKNFESADKQARYRILDCIYGTTFPKTPHLYGWYPEILNDHLIYIGMEKIIFSPAQVYHWGYNMRVECYKSDGKPNPEPEKSQEMKNILNDVETIKLSDIPNTKDLNANGAKWAEDKDLIVPTELPEGYFSTEDIQVYRSLVSNLPDNGSMVEIGVWKGKSLCSIADIIRSKNIKVYAIDTFKGTDNIDEQFLANEAKEHNIRVIFEENIRRFGIKNNVVIMEMDSIEAAKCIKLKPEPFIDFIFIDGDHMYENVKNDINAWMPLMKDGKALAGHDIKWNGVMRAVQEIFSAPDIYAIDNLWWSKKISHNRGRIIDGFIFSNELDIIEMRLNILDDVVDKFVIVESTKTHTNKDKPLYFNENLGRFRKFLHKIEHVIVEDNPDNNDDPWSRERHQRDCIMRGLKDMRDDDIVMISDADEIANPELLKIYSASMGPKMLCMKLFYYALNVLAPENKWQWLKIVPWKVIKDNNMTCCQIRYTEFPQFGEDFAGGWHWSYVGNKDFIKNKIESFAHTEHDKPEIKNTIEDKIKNNKDLFGRDITFETVMIDESYPDYVRYNFDTLYKKGFIKDGLKDASVDNDIQQFNYQNQQRNMTILPQHWISLQQPSIYQSLMAANSDKTQKVYEHTIR
jgi:beta-1,4-mannosyl-glycoprotein beta-1,4-N-acetylglucosaminyltransferase